MLKEVLLPDLGEGIDSADVSEILINPGDSVSIDDIILVLESDKASMEIPAEDAGVVNEVFVNAGDEVKTGAPLISVELSSGSTEQKIQEPKEEEPKEESFSSSSSKKSTAVKSNGAEKIVIPISFACSNNCLCHSQGVDASVYRSKSLLPFHRPSLTINSSA